MKHDTVSRGNEEHSLDFYFCDKRIYFAKKMQNENIQFDLGI